jgi:hypothetical protein
MGMLQASLALLLMTWLTALGRVVWQRRTAPAR